MSAFPFDAVIFDMDGVIVDTEYYYLGETAAFAKELGLNLTQEELNGQVGTSHQFFLHMLVDWFERAGKGHFTGEEALARWDEWAHKRPRDYQALINPGAVDTIRELPRRGVRVALASSSPMVSIEEVLNACGLSDAFEYVVSGEQFKESKPEPDIYLHALDLLGLPAIRVKLAWMYMSIFLGFALLMAVKIELILRSLIQLVGQGDRLTPIQPIAMAEAE